MSQTPTPDGSGHRDNSPIHHDRAPNQPQAAPHRFVGYVERADAFADAAYGREHGITVIDDGCPLMFAPTGDLGHKVMRVVFGPRRPGDR